MSERGNQGADVGLALGLSAAAGAATALGGAIVFVSCLVKNVNQLLAQPCRAALASCCSSPCGVVGGGSPVTLRSRACMAEAPQRLPRVASLLVF